MYLYNYSCCMCACVSRFYFHQQFPQPSELLDLIFAIFICKEVFFPHEQFSQGIRLFDPLFGLIFEPLFVIFICIKSINMCSAWVLRVFDPLPRELDIRSMTPRSVGDFSGHFTSPFTPHLTALHIASHFTCHSMFFPLQTP